jgi:hypothetical protein
LPPKKIITLTPSRLRTILCTVPFVCSCPPFFTYYFGILYWSVWILCEFIQHLILLNWVFFCPNTEQNFEKRYTDLKQQLCSSSGLCNLCIDNKVSNCTNDYVHTYMHFNIQEECGRTKWSVKYFIFQTR